jgi:hypothetical protein
MTIKCKAVLLNKMTITMVVSTGALALALFLIFPAVKGYLYGVSMIVMFCSLIYVFYLNKLELLVIAIESDMVRLNFVNNTIYKRKNIIIRKEQITLKQETDKIIFFIDGEQQAIVRKKAVDVSDWEKLLHTFTTPA